MWGIATVVVMACLHGQAEPPDLAELEPLEEFEPLEVIETPEAAPPPAQPRSPGIDPNYLPGTLLYVNATSLALRSGPKRDAALKFYIPKNTRVRAIVDVLNPVEDKIGGKTGQWLYIQYGEHKGYVFDPYLVEVPPSLDQALDWKCEPGIRVGPINGKTTYDDLLLIFGEANLGEANIPVGDNKVEPGVVIFPEDDDRRIFIQWAIRNVQPKLVIVEGKRWKTTKGVGLGTRLSKLVELNGGPVYFAGFDWDFAGYVTSWNGGALEKDHVLREKMTLYLAPKKPYIPEDYQALVGDVQFSSDRPEASRLNLEVSAMTILIEP